MSNESHLTSTGADLDDTIAPPRKNGELVFEAPWESRAFGMAMTLHERGTYRWKEFSGRLAAEIAATDTRLAGDLVLPVAPDAEKTYYEHWLRSLEKLLVEKGMVSREELELREAEFAAGEWDHEH